MNKDKIIVGIESSCDETSIAVVRNGREVLSNVVSTQIPIHKIFGGVVPEVASRNHIKNIDEVFNLAMKEAGITVKDIDGVAVTYGAGLVGALMVGVSFAKGLSYRLKKPLLAVNHIEGHICGNYLNSDLKPPFICLICSGGHTAILKVTDYKSMALIGSSQDDAIGEMLDKVARVLGLGYPGGPKIDAHAKMGKADITFRKSNALAKTFDFSFSGLKTAVINYINNLKQKNAEIPVDDICASLMKESVTELVEKGIAAAKKHKMKKIAIAGGVAASEYFRNMLEKRATEEGLEYFLPERRFCTDNASMIASRGYYDMISKMGEADLSLTAKANIPMNAARKRGRL